MPTIVDGKLVALTAEEYSRDQRYLNYYNMIHGRWIDVDWFDRLIDAIRQKQTVLTSRNSELIYSFNGGSRAPALPMDTVVIFGVNLPRNIVTMMADFILGSPPTISMRKGNAETDSEKAEQEAIDLAERLETMHFWTTFSEAAIDVGAYGSGYIKLIPENYGNPLDVAIDVNGQAIGYGQRTRLSICNPRHVFVETDPLNKKRAKAIEIRFPFTYLDRDYLYCERHTVDDITITAYKFSSKNRVIDDPRMYQEANQELEKEPYPGVLLAALNIKAGTYPNPLREYADILNDPFLIQPIHNFRAGDEYHGFSDFEGHEGALDEVMHRMSMLSRGMDLTDDPKANAPENTFQSLPDGGRVFRMAGARVFPMDAAGNGVEPIVWDQKVTEKWTAIEKLILRILSATEISLDLVAPDLARGGRGADSGIAMQFRLIPTINKRNRLRRYFDEAFNDVLKKMVILEKPMKKRGEQPYKMDRNSIPLGYLIQWNESAVKDRNEEVKYWEGRIAGGLSTRVEAMMALDGISEEEAEARLEKVIAEQEKFLPSPLKAGLTDPDLGDPNDGDEETKT